MIERVTYTTQPSAQSMGRYITVYAPDGSYVSRHINMEECTESALAHAQANEISGTYRFVPPEKHMSVQIVRTVPGVYTGSYIADVGLGRVRVSGLAGSVQISTGGDPYDLSGYSIPFSYSWPTSPNITNGEATVTPATLAANNVNGRRLTLTAGSYGDVSPADDQEWILESGALIDTFTFTGSQRVKVRGSTPRVGRIGRFTADATGTTDILFDGVYVTSHSGSTGDIWSSPNGQRIAVVNSSLRSQSYVIFPVTANSSLSNNLIVAGNYIYTSSSVPAGAVYGNQHAMRCMSVNTTIIADNYIQKDDGGQGIRIHSNDSPATGTYDVFIGGNTLAYASGLGFAQCITVQPSSGNDFPQGIARVYVESNEMHNNSGGCIALQDDTTDGGVATAPLYDACEFNNNNAYGSLGLPGDLSPYSSTASGNTESSYVAAPSAASVLGWTP